MKPEEFEKRVNEATSEESAESLEALIATIREDLGHSDTTFLRLSYLLGVSILAYHLIAFGYVQGVSFGGGTLSNVDVFEKAFLVFPSGVYLVLMATGYTRVYQKRMLELLMKTRHPGFYRTDLDCLLQKPNFILSLDYLRREPGFGKNRRK